MFDCFYKLWHKYVSFLRYLMWCFFDFLLLKNYYKYYKNLLINDCASLYAVFTFQLFTHCDLCHINTDSEVTNVFMLLPLHLHGIFHFVPVDEKGSFSEHQIWSANTSFVCLLPTQVSSWVLLFPPTFILAKRAAALQPGTAAHFKTGRTHWSQTQTGDKKQHWKGMLDLSFHTR